MFSFVAYLNDIADKGFFQHVIYWSGCQASQQQYSEAQNRSLSYADKKSSCVSIHYGEYGLAYEEYWDSVISFLAESVSHLCKIFTPHLDIVAKE